MSASSQFYLKQAEQCELAAAASSLNNQRDTLLRSRLAWLELANRELEVQAGREKRERDRLQALQSASPGETVNG
ncbi:hypothetical protein [Novosphingobium sp.]|uniref:hypothetical protein n=1 Tax=Novosphingobium sp. TaxID=1874826 RepID=UPI0025CC9BE3|nr:hypothetical protein [Novosphingobium sp.]MCC6925195.1 hypothetical protein [Novosphingobium sp.]